MMNVVALGFVLTSLVTAGLFSPNPEKHNPNQDVIVKEGHRVVVVEFEKDEGKTKVIISPQDTDGHKVDDKMSLTHAGEKMEDMKEKAKYAASNIVPGMDTEESHGRFRPTEMICDAYGKCKHKIASVVGKSKEAVVDKAHEVEEEAKGTIGSVKDTVTGSAHQAGDKAEEIKDSATDASNRAKEKIVGKSGDVKEGVKDHTEKAKGRVHDVIDSTKKVKDEIQSGASSKIEGAKDKMEDLAEKAKDSASKVKSEGKKELTDIASRARELLVDVFRYVASMEWLSNLAGIIHLMGFAAAYGMCVWVTFASSNVLANALPRNQFAMVQSKIYPAYFKAMVYSVGIALLGYLMGLTSFATFSESFSLVATLGMILMNMMYLEPRATKVMFNRMKKDKEEGQSANVTDTGVRVSGPVAETAGKGNTAEELAAKSEMIRTNEVLSRLNSYSSFLNVLTLASLTWHLVHLGQRLNVGCRC